MSRSNYSDELDDAERRARIAAYERSLFRARALVLTIVLGTIALVVVMAVRSSA